MKQMKDLVENEKQIDIRTYTCVYLKFSNALFSIT